MSEILADSRLAGTPPADLVRAVDVGVAMGLFDIATGAVREVATDPPQGVAVPHAFNRAVLAADALGGRSLALASVVTGTGHTVGDLDAAILHEMTERGVDGLAGRVDGRLVAGGRALQRDGKAVTEPAERLALVGQACATFSASTLPHLERLGIVERA